jgi:hypothetical protein
MRGWILALLGLATVLFDVIEVVGRMFFLGFEATWRAGEDRAAAPAHRRPRPHQERQVGEGDGGRGHRAGRYAVVALLGGRMRGWILALLGLATVLFDVIEVVGRMFAGPARTRNAR